MRTVVVVCVALAGCKSGDGRAAVEREDDVESEAPRGRVPMVALEKVVDGLVAPTDLVTAPDGTLVVLEQDGRLLRIDGGTPHPFGDLRDRVVDLQRDYDERGLLGLAFHPDWPQSRRVFAYYSAPLRASAPANFDHTNVLARFEVTADGQLDPASEVKLIELDWPAPNHDGGTLLFGPDRMLYFSMGDGGDAADIGTGHPPAGNGQDWTTLMGSILRIDPDGGEPYGIPDDNPFALDHPGADEIWAYGLRNPYSFSIDRETGRMFAGDVGQELVEEIDLVERGRNYGWSVKEGPFCFDELSPLRPAARCNDVGLHGEPLVDPIAWYTQLDSAVADRSQIHGISVIGGHVYRGSRIPELRGVYVFGDWTRRKDVAEGVLAVARETASGWTLEPLRVDGRRGAHLGMYVRGFGEDADGEIYVLTSTREGIGGRTGVVWRIAPAPVRTEA